MTAKKLTIRLATNDVEKLKALGVAQARGSFYAFRRMMRPDMLRGWFVEDLELKL
jgi:hypothetical protein